jgi:hypothetical protein
MKVESWVKGVSQRHDVTSKVTPQLRRVPLQGSPERVDAEGIVSKRKLAAYMSPTLLFSLVTRKLPLPSTQT